MSDDPIQRHASGMLGSRWVHTAVVVAALGGGGTWVGSAQLEKLEKRQSTESAALTAKIESLTSTIARMEREFSVTLSERVGDGRVVVERLAATERRMDERFAEVQRQLNELRRVIGPASAML